MSAQSPAPTTVELSPGLKEVVHCGQCGHRTETDLDVDRPSNAGGLRDAHHSGNRVSTCSNCGHQV